MRVSNAYQAANYTNVTTGSGGGVFTSNKGPRLTTSGSPSSFTVKSGGTFNYSAEATDYNGVEKIDLYVNEAKVKTCGGATCNFASVYYSNGNVNRAVKFRAVATNRYGYNTGSAVETLVVNGTAISTASSVSSKSVPPAIWTWTIPGYITTLNGTASYHVGAWDNDGIAQVEIMVNGTVRRNCYFSNAQGNVECGLDISSADYTDGSNITLSARGCRRERPIFVERHSITSCAKHIVQSEEHDLLRTCEYTRMDSNKVGSRFGVYGKSVHHFQRRSRRSKRRGANRPSCERAGCTNLL